MKHTVQTATSLSLSALLVLSSSLPSIAQLPAIRTPAPTRNPNLPRIPPPPPGSSLPIGNSGSLTQEAAYTLGPGDRIALDIFGVPEFSKEYQVLVDGTINLPIIRSVSIQGLTLQQAATVITKRYEPFINVPVVTVTVIVARPLNIGLAGEVTRPGSYKINPTREGGGVKFPTLMEMLQLAKGVTSAGDMRNVQIRRSRRGGVEQVTTVNLQDFLDTGNLSQDVTIRDGDTIFVPTASSLNTQEVRQRASANFSADITKPIGVVIVGEVNRPGPYTVSASDLRSTNQQTDLSFVSIDQQQGAGAVVGLPTITRALKIAGGITTEADIRRVQIRRRIRGGTEQTIMVNLWDLLQKGDATQDVLLQEGDSIIIPTASTVDLAEVSQLGSTSFSPNAISINIVGEVIRPGALLVKPSTSLHQALLTAGSFNQLRAKKDKVELLRLNANGTVTRRTIDVDFAQGLNPDNNPTLRNNDVILVARSGYTRVADNITTFLQPITGVATGIGSVSNIFTGFQTTINAFQNLFLGGDFERKNQLDQLRQQREDRQQQREDRQFERERQAEDRQQQAEDRRVQAEDRQLQLQDRQRQIDVENQRLQIQNQQLQLQQQSPQQIQSTP
ncbi:polysaccharide biosynthesis/export family protein [Lyngbya sp. CCAP 1446/10]|uniref:polysaccharide biosynthesis/export family protein n=1 Tax=Lyngbya sp. CCAP 1446/10 TaxID=439293 RepID=UPI0022387CFD|nr:polysaccharide biosynthesis/export family protein [Lyngbya sp. CCAP 1446/10]MCW6049920.1 polysaccharide biosynthesis/export family protein [Lyngbya sp. CCAP 1446/10]